METKVYNQKGEEVGKLKLSEKLFNFPWNPELVRQVSLAEKAGQRKGQAHTKDRSEVSGGGRKPWRQKGTGRARHGSIRSPIWIGGGVTHGPRNQKIREEKINKKAKRKAFLTVLSQRLREGEILFLDELKISEAKAKRGQEVLKNLSKISGFEKIDPKSSTLIILPALDEGTWRSLRNIKNITLSEARNLNAAQLLAHKFLVMPQAAGRVLEEAFLK